MARKNHITIVSAWRLALLAAVFVGASSVGAVDSDEVASDEVDFEREIKPVLENKCLGCHNPNIAKGDLVLSEAHLVFQHESKLIVPGDPLASELYLAATPEAPGERPYMPEEGDPLTEAEAELLKKWIEGGADWPEGLVLHEASKTDKSWWAYQPLAEPKHPTIDRFVEERLARDGLVMNPPADRRVLVRRATYDLTGLPPTAEEVESFVNDSDPEAYEKLIDRLLASPRYGERWGRHWLDVIRFGESRGFERNVIIDNLWPFRDYVIRSINEDVPFDRFIREHIAGDVFGKGDPETEIGSAFLVAGPYDDVGNQDADQAAQIRANILDEIINATGEAFLGMTLGCARCHDHKFDPISQRDYYKLYATFAGVRHGERVLATPDEKQKHEAQMKPLRARKKEMETRQSELRSSILERARAKAAEFEKKWTRPVVDRRGTEERFAPVEAKFVRLVCDAQDANPATRTFGIDEFEVWSAGEDPTNVALARHGGKASGRARAIEDFANAYGPQLAIDGEVGARFLSIGGDLTVELAVPTRIDRVVFSSAKGEETPAHRKFVFVADYRIEVSSDGETWHEAANGRDRKPVNDKHREHRWQLAETTAEEKARLAAIRSELSTVEKEMAAVPALDTVWVGTRNAEDAEGPFHLFVGGSPQKKGETVTPASLSALEDVAPEFALPSDAPEDRRRLELADWIVHRDNPLTPRVLANRVWQYHFGAGIVDTPNDFGYMGGQPTHPELLDFLAAKLKENGWRLKPMHRLVMLSKAYRQSSDWRDEAGEVDGDSRLLWRFPPRRLSAEEIRDTILSVSGSLDETMGGPGFRLYRFMQDNVCTYEPLDQHGPETYRRAVYHQNARASVVDLMTEFDQPDCAFSTPERAETTTPLQALTMLNHSFTLDMAEALAERIESAAEDSGERVEEAFRLAYQRKPDAEERRESLAAVEKHGLRAFCRALLNSSELLYLD
ncbi:MAG: DUF1553 domain-containing protein [Verrucomicrobiales bacterium]